MNRKETLEDNQLNEILENRDTFYMNPCLESYSSLNCLVKHTRENANIVVEEHGQTPEYPFNRLHFATEFTDSSGKYFMSFKSGTRVEVGTNEYTGRKIFHKYSY